MKNSNLKYGIIQFSIVLLVSVLYFFVENFNLETDRVSNFVYLTWFATLPLQLMLLVTVWHNKKTQKTETQKTKLEKFILVNKKTAILFVSALLFNNVLMIPFTIMQNGAIAFNDILFNLLATVSFAIISIPLFYAYNLLANKFKIRYIALFSMILTFASIMTFFFVPEMFNQWYNILMLPTLSISALGAMSDSGLKVLKELSIHNIFFLLIVSALYYTLFSKVRHKFNTN